VFGSNFDQVFGIPAFPLQGADAQGGLFGANIQPPGASDQVGNGPAPLTGAPTAPPSAAGPAALGANNPLGAGPLAPPSGLGQPAPAPDGGMMTPPPPAAGISSPFGKPQV
jgi:hypothetical protein